jgi:hypothetical protein
LDSEEVRKLCDYFQEYRKANLLFAESCLELGKINKGVDSSSHEEIDEYYSKTFCQNYSAELEKIHTENQQLKKTILAKYIEFGEGFDPFFMNQYELIQSKQGTVHEEVAKAYNLGISLSHRLMKAKKDILNCFQGSVKDNKWEGQWNRLRKAPLLIEPDKI